MGKAKSRKILFLKMGEITVLKNGDGNCPVEKGKINDIGDGDNCWSYVLKLSEIWYKRGRTGFQ